MFTASLNVHDSILVMCAYRIIGLFGTSEHVPLLECRRTEVNRNIYNTGAPAFSVNSQSTYFSAIGACAKKRDYTVCVSVRELWRGLNTAIHSVQSFFILCHDTNKCVNQAKK